MRGLGDSIYERPFIRALARSHDLFLQTPWPELFEDIPYAHFVIYSEKLRTQAKNLARNRRRLQRLPPVNRKVKATYGTSNPYLGILPDYAAAFGVPFEPALFDLPPGVAPPVPTTKPIALIRPVTVRNEWANPARNCLPQYLNEAAVILRERFHVVSVADVVESGEWFDGNPPTADTSFHRGELTLPQLLGLVHRAAVIVGGVGWIAPAAAAAKRPLILIAGGQGAWNAPSLIFSPEVDASRIRWIMPDQYCRCAPADHGCNKRITNFPAKFRAALTALRQEAA
jgi:hypothetical protein